jgi:hypothetical protein
VKVKHTKVLVPGCIDEVHTIVLARSGEEMYAVRVEVGVVADVAG